ncbi:MAG TPA: TIGR03960 family B12-binding radical SAM protein [Aggregatilinea sp.]|uniref:TIGR03960 family B12-binding radical SAM protein n=1 Tax=Aggregatilinea sp. TaxID=2806333 RepID=UPI002C47A175|nr:TIGR03960 family B12-binding radical SAM protein [Aggregatilinea sp.]HML21214.1 TIGR03960 family B12-binding radical SAM protein [Aggregatilinea sp.]
MHATPETIERTLDRVLLEVQKPGRYIGGEYNSVDKDWNDVAFHTAFAFPDLYDLGMSNLGWMILYDIINKQPDMFADRVFSPWTDMEAVMRREGLPLYGLNSKRPIAEFDLLGISLPYEQLYTNVLNMFDLAGMPVRAADRDERYPVVIAGGHACYNPEPMANFIDAFAIGEGEDIIFDVAQTLKAMRGASREEQMHALAQIEGVYVPRFYEASYHADGTIQAVTPTVPDVPRVVRKRIVPVLPPPFTKFLVPHVDTVHNRAPIEIMRGCTRGCRFCHAGMVTRPVRERSVDEIIAAADEIVRNTGFEELSLLSLSSSDYTHVMDLVKRIGSEFPQRGLSVSLPSLRIESVSVDLMDALKDSRRGGFTFAPEAATEHMRDIINKSVPDSQLLSTAHEVYSRGWLTIKLYFMIGHPSETLEDVQSIVDLAKAVLAEGRKIHGKKATVNVGVSTFVPKPHTPFEWVPLDTLNQIRAKQDLLKRGLRGNGLNLRWNKPEETMLEAYLSRGDRRLGSVIERAWQLGTKFDAWQELHNQSAWEQAFAENGLEMDFYTHRPRSTDEIFPWDHIDIAVKKSFLVQDYEMSQVGETRVDCRNQCFACGILPKFRDTRMETPADAWQCPPVMPRHMRGKKAEDMIPLTALN